MFANVFQTEMGEHENVHSTVLVLANSSIVLRKGRDSSLGATLKNADLEQSNTTLEIFQSYQTNR